MRMRAGGSIRLIEPAPAIPDCRQFDRSRSLPVPADAQAAAGRARWRPSPGRRWIVADVDHSGLYSEPSTPAYERARELCLERAARRGAGANLGRELPRLYLEAGLPDPETAIFHPIYLRGERKRFGEFTLLEGTYFVDQGICSQAELDRLAAELAAIAADETIAVAQAISCGEPGPGRRIPPSRAAIGSTRGTPQGSENAASLLRDHGRPHRNRRLWNEWTRINEASADMPAFGPTHRR
jgi:hypothetical protein